MTKRHLIAALLALLILAISSISMANTCRDTCYQEKSTAYQRCRIIPPAERTKRVACFKKADAALKQCLAKCGPAAQQ